MEHPKETYSDQLLDSMLPMQERYVEMENAIADSQREYEKYLADEIIRKERDKILRYSGDCPIQKAIVLMLNYRLGQVEKQVVEEYLKLVNKELLFKYINSHKCSITGSYIGNFI